MGEKSWCRLLVIAGINTHTHTSSLCINSSLTAFTREDDVEGIHIMFVFRMFYIPESGTSTEALPTRKLWQHDGDEPFFERAMEIEIGSYKEG